MQPGRKRQRRRRLLFLTAISRTPKSPLPPRIRSILAWKHCQFQLSPPVHIVTERLSQARKAYRDKTHHIRTSLPSMHSRPAFVSFLNHLISPSILSKAATTTNSHVFPIRNIYLPDVQHTHLSRRSFPPKANLRGKKKKIAWLGWLLYRRSLSKAVCESTREERKRTTKYAGCVARFL